MFQYQFIIKVMLICLGVNGMLFLPNYLLLIFSDDLSLLNIIGGGQFILQDIILCFGGFWLSRDQLKKKSASPALYDKTILQFISQYGLVVLLSGILLYAYTQLNWPFSYSVGDRVWSPEHNRYLLLGHHGGGWQFFVHRCLTWHSLVSYWLMYITYGWTNSRQQVRIKHEMQ